MKWLKLGKIFQPDGKINWMKTHASLPFVDNIGGNEYKIYFTSRNEKNQSHTGFIVININEPYKVLDISTTPVLTPGKLGFFDDSGAMGSCLINLNGKKYLYYIGWNLCQNIPFRNSIGLAISNDNGKSFKKYSKAPIMDRSEFDPIFASNNVVLYDNKVFKTWYISCYDWKKTANISKHFYHIKCAQSIDGINWQRKGEIAIDFKDKYEYALSRPWVIKDNELFKMWYSYRAQKNINAYRIGYAESEDGITWDRKDYQAGIDVSLSGWDSEMICYPHVFKHNNQTYMLYNGNEYGKTGFGLAALEDK